MELDDEPPQRSTASGKRKRGSSEGASHRGSPVVDDDVSMEDEDKKSDGKRGRFLGRLVRKIVNVIPIV
jgi:hypothetical protein